MKLIFTFITLIIFFEAKSFEYKSFGKNESKPSMYNLDKAFFKSRNRDFANLSLYYTSIKHVGFEMSVGKDFLLGWGASFATSRNGHGENYTGIFGINTYQNDIYKIHTTKTSSVYAIIGANHKKLTLGCMLGMGQNATFYNGYDNSQILSPSGYWYLIVKNPSTFLYGAQIQYIVAKKISTYIGYDNFHKYKFGIGITFKQEKKQRKKK
jgi:hypothetical protein